jgi:hypothetical protein
MPKLLLKKEKHFIFISKSEHDYIRYNLKSKSMEKQDRSGNWVEVEKQYKFFRGYSVRDLDAEPKFLELIRLSQKYNENCKSLSTFISRLDEVLIYENFILMNVDFRPDRQYSHRGRDYWEHLDKGINEYDKITIKLLQETGYTVSKSFERRYFKQENSSFFRTILNQIAILNIERDQKISLLDSINYRMDELRHLIEDYKYHPKALFGYLVNYLKPFENLGFSESIRLLDDYYRMGNLIGRNVKKYPKYLKSMHDIILANYEAYKRVFDEELFAKVQKPELEFNDKEYCMVIPKSSKEVVSEGTSLNHCVSSYVDKIISGKTLILFLRKKERPENSLVTVEFKEKKIVQAKGSYNRKIDEHELSFLQKFCKAKEIELEI